MENNTSYIIHSNTQEYAIFSFENYLGIIWKTRTSVDGIHAASVAYEELRAKNPVDKQVFITIVPANTRNPDSETSFVIRQFLKNATNALASVVIHQDIGWRITIVRSITATHNWMANLKYPHKAFSTVADAAFWLEATYNIPPKRFFNTVTKVIQDLHGPVLPPIVEENDVSDTT